MTEEKEAKRKRIVRSRRGVSTTKKRGDPAASICPDHREGKATNPKELQVQKARRNVGDRPIESRFASKEEPHPVVMPRPLSVWEEDAK